MWCCNLRSHVLVAEDIHWSVGRVHGIRKDIINSAWSCVPTATVMRIIPTVYGPPRHMVHAPSQMDIYEAIMIYHFLCTCSVEKVL